MKNHLTKDHIHQTNVYFFFKINYVNYFIIEILSYPTTQPKSEAANIVYLGPTSKMLFIAHYKATAVPPLSLTTPLGILDAPYPEVYNI